MTSPTWFFLVAFFLFIVWQLLDKLVDAIVDSSETKIQEARDEAAEEAANEALSEAAEIAESHISAASGESGEEPTECRDRSLCNDVARKIASEIRDQITDA